jgi:tetratricopeptide (TPR) repeat protein
MSVALTDTLYRALTLYEEGKRRDDTEMLHEAVTLCDAVVTLEPENADAWQIAGLVRLAQGADEAAKSAFVEAMALMPEIVANHINLATAHLRLGETEPALRVLLQAIELRKDLPEAYYNLGNTLIAAGHLEDAEEAFKKAIALKPDYPEALNNLGQRLRNRGDPEGAVSLFQQAIECDEGYGPPWRNLCAALTEIDKFAEAIEVGRQAVHRRPEDEGAHYALGNAFAIARRPAEASPCFRRAIEINPEHDEAYVNLGVMQLDLGDIDGALRLFDRALALNREDAKAHWNKAVALLLAGRFEEAWPYYEWRWQALVGLEKPEIVEPWWDGSEGNGTILLYCEQALGDAMQYVRFLPHVRGRGWRIVLECAPKLVRLFADSGLADLVVASGQRRPAFDCWLPIMSLPGIFGMTIDTVPAQIPYLVAKQKPMDDRVLRLSEQDVNVGIVWQGSLTNKRGRIRTSRLADFAPLRDVQGISLFSLQSELSEDDAALLKDYGIPDLETGHRDFADTATIVGKLDLVITVDTAMVHLAGALGCRVWALLPVYPDWRWMRDRDDSPWYPNLRLFRQTAPGDWASVIDAIRCELECFAREQGVG